MAYRNARQENEGEKKLREQNRRVRNAIAFATSAHAGQKRKLGGGPFIDHPMEVYHLLLQMDMIRYRDEKEPYANSETRCDLLIAGLLHDTLEDTSATSEQITELFGEDVTKLVEAHTEDKSLPWRERKLRDMEEVRTSGLRVKKLYLADKLANIRSLFEEMEEREDRDSVWSCFNAPKEDQHWVYLQSLIVLEDLKEVPECAPFYEELRKTVDMVFA